MPMRGIRGATTVTADEPELILQATRELLEEILAENEGMQSKDIASAIRERFRAGDADSRVEGMVDGSDMHDETRSQGLETRD